MLEQSLGTDSWNKTCCAIQKKSTVENELNNAKTTAVCMDQYTQSRDMSFFIIHTQPPPTTISFLLPAPMDLT